MRSPLANMSPADAVIVAGFALAFTCSLLFVSAAINLVMLAGAVTALLAASTVAVGRLPREMRAHPAAAVLTVAVLVALAVGYQLSISPDSSFAPTWVVACLPIALLTGLSLEARVRRRLAGVLFLVILAMAANAVVRFLTTGERAHLPLYDPNNFATLCYLAWIPFLHRCLRRAAAPGWAAVTLVLTLAIFATTSRAGAAIVAAALALGWVFVIVARRGVASALAHSLAVLLAFVLYAGLAPALVSDAMSGSDVEAGVSIRFLLIENALRGAGANGVFGVGLLGFPLLYEAGRPLADQHTAGIFVHNDYVQLWLEGGLPLLLPVAGLLGAVVWRIFRALRGRDAGAAKTLGYGVALLAAASHALLNFVIYSLPLTIALGAVGALFLGSGASGATRPARLEVRALTVAGLVFGWLACAYLWLDTAVYGVFQGQRGAPFAARVAGDADARLAFARLAQTLNDDRGIPVLGEAMALAQRAETDADARSRQAALRQFERAIAVDRWNPLAYAMAARFIERHPDTVEGSADEAIAALIDACTTVSPLFAPCLDLAVRRLEAAQGPGLALRYLSVRVLPWLELMRRQDPDAADRYVAWMRDYADRTGAAALREEIETRAAAVAGIKPSRREIWWPRGGGG